MTFKFGGTYKDDCDVCIDDYMTNRQNHNLRHNDLRRQVTMVPRLTAISHDPVVKEQLDRYRDTHPSRPMLMGKLETMKWFYTKVILVNSHTSKSVNLKCHDLYSLFFKFEVFKSLLPCQVEVAFIRH